MKKNLLNLAQSLNSGNIGVLPTDTLYGLVGRALDKKAVERIYQVKGRAPEKPCIILISEIDDVSLFGITLDLQTTQLIDRFWPGPVSIILSCADSPSTRDLEYLHRGTKSLAFRLPADIALLELLAETGPLVAPSANPEGKEPAHTAAEAQAYFGDSVDFYSDAGMLQGAPSTLIEIKNGKVVVLRQGAAVLPPDVL